MLHGSRPTDQHSNSTPGSISDNEKSSPKEEHIYRPDSHLIGDIIEMKKNKEKRHQSGTLLNASIGLCMSMLIVIGMFEWKVRENGSLVALTNERESFEDLMEIPPSEHQQPPPPKVQAPQIIEVSDEEITEEIEVDLDIEMTEDTKIEEVIYSDEEAMPEERADEIFTIVEEQPAPVGGMQAFYDFVSKNLKYPSLASRSGIEGRVFVQFVVEKDGDLTDIQVVKGIGGGCDEEAARVLALAPNWQPGKQRGEPVRVRMILPIMFKLTI